MILRKCLAFFLILQLVLLLISTAYAGSGDKSAKEHPWDEVKETRPFIFSAETIADSEADYSWI